MVLGHRVEILHSSPLQRLVLYTTGKIFGSRNVEESTFSLQDGIDIPRKISHRGHVIMENGFTPHGIIYLRRVWTRGDEN